MLQIIYEFNGSNLPNQNAGSWNVSYQWLSHDDADLAFWQCGEVGEEALEDILARFAFGVHGDRHDGNRTFPLALTAAHWREGGLSYGGRWTHRTHKKTQIDVKNWKDHKKQPLCITRVGFEQRTKQRCCQRGICQWSYVLSITLNRIICY